MEVLAPIEVTRIVADMDIDSNVILLPATVVKSILSMLCAADISRWVRSGKGGTKERKWRQDWLRSEVYTIQGRV